jgi:bifunctional non-homologous end joining protein LigD
MRWDEPGWIWELKQDGYRLMSEFGGGRAALRSRNGADATRWFPELTRALATVAGGPYVVDGEVCVLDDIGRSDFNRLHERAARRGWYDGADPVVYVVFDLLVSGRRNLMELPLLSRKAELAKLFENPPGHVLVSGHFDSEAETLFNVAVQQLKLEGLVAKRAESFYLPGTRTPDWVKVKRKGAVPAGRFKRDPR